MTRPIENVKPLPPGGLLLFVQLKPMTCIIIIIIAGIIIIIKR